MSAPAGTVTGRGATAGERSMGGWDELYRENILDHYKHPRNQGTLEHPDVSFEDANPLCGDRLRMDFQIRDGRITAVRFSGQGCSISQASASMLSEKLEGMSLEEAKKIGREDVLEMLGIELGPVRLKCALLALKTLKGGVYGIHQWPGEEGEENP
jgi:nitrogen fixation protein NifU and related proteins